MQLEVGEVFEGKVTGITKFGAFVAMPDGRNGLVHISEIANTYVNEVSDFVKEGETVKVKVIGIGDGGKVNLSIKQTLPPPPPRQFKPRSADSADRPPQRRGAPPRREEEQRGQVAGPTGDSSFEDKLKEFMKQSDSRIADNKMYADHRSKRRK